MGTTRHAENHTYTFEGVEGTVLLTDTPGLSEIGEAGSDREREARELAARADLLLFVLDHDLIRTEYEPLAALARQGKRSIVVLNKTDRFTESDSCRHPGQAARAAPRAGGGRGCRRCRRPAAADARPAPAGRRHHRDHPRGASSPSSPPSATGSP